MESPKVGVVLVNFNGMKFMPECLDTLSCQTYPNVCPIVVDNASTDGSREWLSSLESSFVTVLLDDNTGITGGNNAGIRKCFDLGCDEIFLLNNDTVLDPDLIARLVEAREPHRLLIPRIYFYDAPGIINTNFGDFDYVRGLSLQRFYGEPDSEATEVVAEGTMASTCALMFPAALVEEIGLMDDNFFIYFDDTDFVARAVGAGYRVKYVPTAKLRHRESSSSGGQPLGPLPLYYQTRNRLYFMGKHQRDPAKMRLFLTYFWLTRAIHVVRWMLAGNKKSIFAFRAAIRDFRAGRLGYAPPARFQAP
jgi:GT2 family glycosyltransferase